MARTSRFPTLSMTLLIASVLLASLVPGAPLADEAVPEATASQTEDTGAVHAFVTDDVGRAIRDAIVTVAYTAFTANTNETGFALIEHLPVDPFNGTHYLVYASKTGYETSEWIDVNVTAWNTLDVSLEINGGFLYGAVEDAVGPVPNATVTIRDLEYSNVTNSEGVYSIRGVPGGYNLTVGAVAVGYATQNKTVKLEVGGFEVLDFLLVSLTGAISGTVTDVGTDEALYNASVSVRVGVITITATTDVDGAYRIPNLPSGVYSVTAAMTGFEPSTKNNVAVFNGVETVGVDFQLAEKPTKLYGVVRAGTFLVPGALITVVGTDLSTNTSIEGYYEIANITVGTHSLTASLEGYNTVTVTGIVIVRGGETQVNINMTSLPGPSLSGMVMSTKTHGVLSGVAVVVLSQGVQRSTITNTEGLFVVPGLTKGNYTVRFYVEGYRPLELSVVAVPEEGVNLGEVMMSPLAESFGGFIFGFDLAHSMMILALFLTIIILALAVMLRVRGFEAPDKTPAVYDQEGEEEEVPSKHPARAREKDRDLRKRDKKKR